MNTVRCDCCGNLTYYTDEMKISKEEYYSGKPYKVEFIECPECGSNVYFTNEYGKLYEEVLKKATIIRHKLNSLRDVVIVDEDYISNIQEDNLLYVLDSDEDKPTKLGFKMGDKLFIIKCEEE